MRARYAAEAAGGRESEVRRRAQGPPLAPAGELLRRSCERALPWRLSPAVGARSAAARGGRHRPREQIPSPGVGPPPVVGARSVVGRGGRRRPYESGLPRAQGHRRLAGELDHGSGERTGSRRRQSGASQLATGSRAGDPIVHLSSTKPALLETQLICGSHYAASTMPFAQPKPGYPLVRAIKHQ
jgi:hypothetical protein